MGQHEIVPWSHLALLVQGGTIAWTLIIPSTVHITTIMSHSGILILCGLQGPETPASSDCGLFATPTVWLPLLSL
ncbi:hypothetical protein BC826DRAFT_1041779, partial [Russula brevipes]